MANRSYAALGGPNWNPLPVVKYDWQNGVALEAGPASTQTPAFADETTLMLVSDVDCFISVGTNPVAAPQTAGNTMLSAGERFHLVVGAGEKIAAIQKDSAGGIYIVPAAKVE